MNLFYKNEKGDFVQVGVNSPLPVTMTASNGGGGNSFIVDDSNPDTELGEDGDSFLNSSTGDLFSKDNGDWVNVGNLKGQDGADGFPSEAQWNDLVNRVEILEGDE